MIEIITLPRWYKDVPLRPKRRLDAQEKLYLLVIIANNTP